MTEINIQSKTLEMLDYFNIKYIIKNSNAALVDFDSLNINLTGKWAGFWKRWSNNDNGKNHYDLALYLYNQGLITDTEKYNNWVAEHTNGNIPATYSGNNQSTSSNSEHKTYTVKEVEDYDFSTMVTNPDTEIIDDYLTNTRMLSPVIINRAKELGVIVQDGRDNARFLWLDNNHSVIGADVQGTVYDKEKYTRGTLKLILPGSKGFFWMVSKDVKKISDIKRIVFTEAPIDTLSFIELSIKTKAFREHSQFEFPKATKETMYISFSGAVTKLESTLKSLEHYFGLDYKKMKAMTEIIVATDNDEAGQLVEDSLIKDYRFTNLRRELPNNGVAFEGETIKDWNDLLKKAKINFK